MFLVSLPGSRIWIYLLVAAACVILALLGLRREAVICGSAIGLGALVNWILKFLIARPRPEQELIQVLVPNAFHSFPSGHVVVYVQLFGFLLYILFTRRTARRGIGEGLLMAVCLILILTIGLSRVYLGVHWPSDVIGGYLLGGAWLAGMIYACRSGKFLSRLSGRPDQR